MNKKLYNGIILVFLTLFVVSATMFVTKAAFNLLVTPLSGEPGDVVAVRTELSGDFEPLVSVGIGFGAEVIVTNEPVTLTATGAIITQTGLTANHPIKPGSFRWRTPYGALIFEIFDNGDGTLDDTTGFLASGIINYTSGFFSRTAQMGLTMPLEGSTLNYTTYENDVTPAAGVTTTGSGTFLATITVPSVANGSYTITAFDEVGNVGTVNFQVVGSDVIPEPLTVGAIVLLSSIAVMVSFYWLRKRSLPKV